MKTLFMIFTGISIFLITGINAYSQAVLGISAGAGAGKLSQEFTQFDNPVTFSHAAPGTYISGELSWGRFYFDMSLALLFASDNMKLGEEDIDLSDYSSKLALDFTAIGIGYLYPINEKLESGGALGFHVAAPTLTPEDIDDMSKLRFGGYYGLIGLSVVPRIRYSVNHSIKLTLNLPIGMDFGAMSEDIVLGNARIGKSPAIVQPESLKPEFRGFTYGVYLSAGYFFKLSG